MTYLAERFKYGRKTKAQIDSIPTSNLLVGDNVWNTDINKEEFWTGEVWVNDDCVVMINNEGASVGTGILMEVDNSSSTTYHTRRADRTNSQYYLGAVYRGGDDGDKIVIACKGLYPVYFRSTVTTTTRGNLCRHSSQPGEVIDEGSKTGGINIIGVIAESYGTMPGDRLVNVFIGSKDIY